MEDNEKILDVVLKEEKDNNVVLMTADGIVKIDIDKLIDQDADGLLYDLNRDKASLITIAKSGKNKRWINDYACALVIEKLIQKLAEKKVEKQSSKEEKKNITKTTQIISTNSYKIDGISDDTVFCM